MPSWRMPWGEFKGREIEDIPSNYLSWLARDCDDDEIATRADEEYTYRSTWDTHFYEDQGISPEDNIEMSRIEKEIDGRIPKSTILKEEKMNSDFIPAAASSTPADSQPTTSPELAANLELAKATMDSRIGQILQLGNTLKQLEKFQRIENQQQYDQAIDAFNALKEAINQTEDIRHQYVDFPTQVTKLINGFFKQIRDGLEKTKNHIGRIIQVKKDEDTAAAQRALEESQAKTDAEGAIVPDGDGEIKFEPETQVPTNVVSSERGAKVHSRSDIHVEIVDLDEFLKACVSKNKRNLWLSENVSQIIDVKMAALRGLIKENKKKVVPGLEVRTISKVV